MNLDIFEINDGEDLVLGQSEAARAGNVLSIQLGSLEYAPTFGVDLTYFLTSDFQFQNQSFKAYLVSRVLQHQINVANVLDTVNALYEKYTFNIGNSTDAETGLIL